MGKSKMVCPTCHKQTHVIRSVVVRHEVKQGCDECMPETIQQGHDGAAKFNREWQKTEFRKDLLQVGEPGFIKAYPEQAANYYDDDTRRKYS